MDIETNIDDLTDAGVASFLADLAGAVVFSNGWPASYRLTLKSIVRNLDRASPDWPSRVLGLPL